MNKFLLLLLSLVVSLGVWADVGSEDEDAGVASETAVPSEVLRTVPNGYLFKLSQEQHQRLQELNESGVLVKDFSSVLEGVEVVALKKGVRLVETTNENGKKEIEINAEDKAALQNLEFRSTTQQNEVLAKEGNEVVKTEVIAQSLSDEQEANREASSSQWYYYGYNRNFNYYYYNTGCYRPYYGYNYNYRYYNFGYNYYANPWRYNNSYYYYYYWY